MEKKDESGREGTRDRSKEELRLLVEMLQYFLPCRGRASVTVVSSVRGSRAVE